MVQDAPRATSIRLRRLACLAAAIVMFMAAPAHGQEIAPAAPAGCANGESACAPLPASSDRSSFSAAAIEQRVSGTDRKFQVVMGTFITAAGSDIALSMYQIGRGNAREAGFGRWWQDNPATLALTKSAMIALFTYELQEVHKQNPKLAFVLGIAATAVESSLAVRSARMQAHIVSAPPAY